MPATTLQTRFRRVGAVVIGLCTLAMLSVVVRVASLQQEPAPQVLDRLHGRLAKRPTPAVRASVLDRRGRTLAVSRVAQRVVVDPARFAPPYAETLAALAEKLRVPVPDVAAAVMPKVAENDRRKAEGRSLRRYARVGGPVADAVAEAVEAMKLPGVWLEDVAVRELLAEGAMAAFVGKVGAGGRGAVGAEHRFDDALRGEAGSVATVVDAQGRTLWMEAGGYRAPQSGDEVRLSIDAVIQRLCERELARGVQEADAAGGRCVVVDPVTGEVLAMADTAREIQGVLDPLLAPSVHKDGDPWRRYRVLPESDHGRRTEPALARLRCVEDAYEPGSTFKPFVWAMATEMGVAHIDEVLDTGGGYWWTPYGRHLKDVARRDQQTWRDVLVNSSNIGMSQIAERMTPAQLRSVADRFGFGTPTGIGFPGESAGLVTPLKSWTRYSQSSVSFGQEVAVTPVQLVRGFCAFARTGQLAGSAPRLRIDAAPLDTTAAATAVRAVEPWAALLARDAMVDIAEKVDKALVRSGVLDGSFRYDYFGKSGTAMIPKPQGGGYFYEQYVSNFIAGAPVAHPRIVVLVVIDDPGPERVKARRFFGSSVAAPVVRRIIESTLAYLGEPPVNDLQGEPGRTIRESFADATETP